MPNIIVAGRFEQQADADAAVAELVRRGFDRDHVTSFFVNPPGQHAQFPLGGDRAVSPGAKTGGVGAATGAAVGGAVGLGLGLAATPVVGPVAVPAAAGVGAYVGALAGALGKMEDSPAEARPYEEAPPEVRHAGVVVAAHAPEPEQRASALDVLQAAGAQDIETPRAIGAMANGPTSIPSLHPVPKSAVRTRARSLSTFASRIGNRLR
ncbi:MAG: hypothetical protein M3R31_01380 [Pseudomonadota bacterium]|nr:hypothetical protein [Pseudomonadota bacterium]